MTAVETVGIYEAKTHLPRLVSRVEQGLEVLITRHGKPVARLIPFRDDEAKRAALARLGELRSSVIGPPVTRDEILGWVHEGRL